jgi:Mg2+ and Co2+ transporter CorA
VIRFHLKEAPAKDAKTRLDILDANGAVIREYKSDADSPGAKLEPKAGMNRVVWDLRHADAEGFPGLVLWGSLTGPRAVPGTYKARLKVGPLEETVEFAVKPDPRASASQSDYEEQLKFLLAVRDKLTEAHRGIKTIRDVRDQLTNLTKRIKGDTEIADASKAIDRKLTAVEEALHQTKAKSSQDVLNFPIRVNNKLASLAGTVGAGDNRPTDQAEQVRKELTQQADAELTKLRQVLSGDLPKFNDLLGKKKVPGVFVDPKPPGK